MAKLILVKGKKPKKGIRMTKGTRWRIAAVSGRNRQFVGTLLHTMNFGAKRIAIFNVPK